MYRQKDPSCTDALTRKANKEQVGIYTYIHTYMYIYMYMYIYRMAQKSKPPPIFQKSVLKIANEIRFLRKVKV